MKGIVALASATLTALVFLGAGASQFSGQMSDPINHPLEPVASKTQSYEDEGVVEGHTTFATLEIDEERVRPPKRAMEKTVECTESQPGEAPVYESCRVHVGPVDPPQDDELDGPTVEEIEVEASFTLLGEYQKMVDEGGPVYYVLNRLP